MSQVLSVRHAPQQSIRKPSANGQSDIGQRARLVTSMQTGSYDESTLVYNVLCYEVGGDVIKVGHDAIVDATGCVHDYVVR